MCKKKIRSFCFSGNKGGKLKKYIDHPILIQSNTTSVVQVVEIAIGQILCNILEESQNEKFKYCGTRGWSGKRLRSITKNKFLSRR